MRRIISVLLENESGALSRVAGLFSARGYNIESLTVAATEDSTLSRMTMVTRGDDNVIEQILKQLNKLIDVVKVVDITEGPHLEREVILVKVQATGNDARDEMVRLIEIFKGKIVDVTETTYTLEMTGDSAKISSFLEGLKNTKILETVRSGITGISRGKSALRI
jgi:acetolactate synthase-1/3 small subunit